MREHVEKLKPIWYDNSSIAAQYRIDISDWNSLLRKAGSIWSDDMYEEMALVAEGILNE